VGAQNGTQSFRQWFAAKRPPKLMPKKLVMIERKMEMEMVAKLKSESKRCCCGEGFLLGLRILCYIWRGGLRPFHMGKRGGQGAGVAKRPVKDGSAIGVAWAP
jgi:hypothetical protein